MYCIPDSITQNEKKKIIQRNVVWSFYLYRNAQIYYYASSLRNNSLFLNAHFELWNLSPTSSRRYIKIHGPGALIPGPNTFLHWIKTSGVKIRPAFKKIIFISWTRVHEHKLTVSQYTPSYMFDKVLGMPLVLNMPGFSIAENSEYISGSACAIVLVMPAFWIYQSFEYASVTHGSKCAWIIPEYDWILNMTKYTWICVNLPKSAWVAFALHFLISQFVLQSLFYLNKRLILLQQEAIYLKI